MPDRPRRRASRSPISRTCRSGFGILANYTYSDAHGQRRHALPYNSKHQVSLSPFFETGPVSLRGTYTWRSKYFTGIDRGDNMYVRDSANVDVSATYNFTKYLGLTLSGMNLTDSQYYAYANTRAAARRVQERAQVPGDGQPQLLIASDRRHRGRGDAARFRAADLPWHAAIDGRASFRGM